MKKKKNTIKLQAFDKINKKSIESSAVSQLEDWILQAGRYIDNFYEVYATYTKAELSNSGLEQFYDMKSEALLFCLEQKFFDINFIFNDINNQQTILTDQEIIDFNKEYQGKSLKVGDVFKLNKKDNGAESITPEPIVYLKDAYIHQQKPTASANDPVLALLVNLNKQFKKYIDSSVKKKSKF